MYEAVEKHYIENRKRLVSRLSFRAGSEAVGEEIVQESYYRALKYLNSFDVSNFDKWFSMILTNTLREYMAIEKGYSSDEDLEIDEDFIECQGYVKMFSNEIYSLIDKKKEEQKEILLMFFKQGYSSVDISRITRYSYSQCHQTIQRFRNELRERYK